MVQAQSTHPLPGHNVRGMASSPPPPPLWPVRVGSLRDSAPSDCEGDWGTQRLLSVCSKEEIVLRNS